MSSEFTIDTVFRISRNAICQHLDDEALLMNATTNETYGLDAMSYIIWQLMQSESTLSPVVNVVSEVMATPQLQVQHDVLAFAEELLQRGFVEVSWLITK